MLVLQKLILAGNVEETLTYINKNIEGINLRDEESGLTPLEMAAREGHFPIVIALLNHEHFILSLAQRGREIGIQKKQEEIEDLVDFPDLKHNDD